MDQTLLFPSPNWYQSSGLAVSNDGWLVYGGPSKSLCVLEPIPADSNTLICGNQGYRAHTTLRAHSEKISCVDVSPEWNEKKAVLTGSTDGTVKQWSLERTQKTLIMKTTHSHEIHSNEKEEVVGVGYCKDGYAVTVGCYGYIVKWDMNSNVVKTFNKVLNNFRPVCMACSPHIHLNVAIGTKQGVIFVLDLNGAARVLYKVKGQDDEILKVGWCPQYEVAVRKSLKESDKKSIATQRMERIRKEPETSKDLKALDGKVKNSCSDQSVDVQETSTSSEQPDQTAKEKPAKTDVQATKFSLNESGTGKTLPEDSFDDQSIVQEDDMFDIYKEPDIEEFGHKKYQPVDLLVKLKKEVVQEEYLADCLKLKEEILKKKNQGDASIESLVEAMDKTQVDVKKNEAKEGASNQNAAKVVVEGKIIKGEVESSVHIHKHLLATVGKYGSVRVWSKSGKLVGSCAIPNAGPFNKNQRNQRGNPNWCNLLWYKSEGLLLVDGKSQLLECNPLKIDCKNKLDYRVFPTLHKRGLSNLATNAPRVQPPELPADRSHDDGWMVWTAAQDRTLIAYSLKKQKPMVVYNTCGGFIYKVVPCPYDAKKVAVAVGDGEVRVWESDTLDEDDTKLTTGTTISFSHNVQGKVLNVAWHPTAENILAFSTREARVGIIDTSGKQQRPARPFPPALTGGVYGLAWGDGWDLYACGGGELALYQGNHTDEVPKIIPVELEGRKLELSAVTYHQRGLVVGSCDGAVAVLEAALPHRVSAAAFVFAKMIHTIDWHPQETSNSSGESPFKNLIAVCSNDRVNTIVILEYGEKEDGTKQLTLWKTLSGHKAAVLELAWNPHLEGVLVSTSADSTVRVWSAESGQCNAIFGGHVQCALTAAWAARPQLASLVASGGSDAALRLWHTDHHPPDAYQERPDQKKDRKRKEKKGKEENKKDEDEQTAEGHEAAVMDSKLKSCKKFLLPMLFRQTNTCKANAPRLMLKKYLEKVSGNAIDREVESLEYDLDFIKLFGNINEVNNVLDMELEWHQDTGNMESWVMLCIFRGYIDAMIQYASQKDLLDAYLLSLAPCVSFKYWKDATQLYLAQIDRLVAKGEEGKLNETKRYGGSIYRKTATLLSLHDVKGALAVLCDAKLFMEAYILCRVRYMDSLADEILVLWADYLNAHGRYNMSSVCFIALGNISQAASVLGKSKEEDSLSLAAEMAKLVGQTTFADHVEAKKREVIKLKLEIEKNNEKAEEMEALPTRAELVLNDVPEQSDSDSYKDSEKDTKSDIIPNSEVEESCSGSLGVHDVEDAVERNVENDLDCSKTTNSAQKEVSVQIGDAHATEMKRDTNNETKECLNHSTTGVKSEKEENKKVEIDVKNGNEEQAMNGKEASDKDKTDELLKELPSKMKDLMTKYSYQNVNIQNGEANEDIVNAKGKGDSDINDNVNEKGDHVTA